MKQHGFFDENDRLKELSTLGDPLEKLNKYINWDNFQGILTKTLKKEAQGPGGRPPFDYVMMFKILILQKLYNVSDDQAEYQIKDRLSFQRFLGLALCDTVPDAKTIWHFREELVKANILDTIFYRFVRQLEEQEIISCSGSIVDATFVDAQRKRNNKGKEKRKKHKKSQKDINARWATKNKEWHYGYKDHIKIDAESKLITKLSATSAAVHDSQELSKLVDEKGYRNRPLTKTQKANNTRKSKIRSRVEHVFATMTNTMRGIVVRSIGMAWAHANIALMNLTYNF
ncbi:IS5 family transposase [Leadbettera azotonutricia]|uniref:Transposase IS4 family protein n=1 Tax=Leadbettera azotonutricia (strain ATCC BAA-888 / DSM 13862 / ZAS-9) TaxID=545695 RepID=F5YCI6_LEAAZ|nr:IS5 family transposase [Leadbettera azotonutricia]AEF81510.1 transposase IS4 family protein [Leadbettera azotonutricia ZAS-9]